MQGLIRLTLSFPRSHFSPQLVVIEICLANLLLWIWVQTMLLVSMCRIMVTHWKNCFIWHWYCGCSLWVHIILYRNDVLITHGSLRVDPSLILALLWSKSQFSPQVRYISLLAGHENLKLNQGNISNFMITLICTLAVVLTYQVQLLLI